MSLHALGNQREYSKKWLPLIPHRKGNEVFGDLLVECFISKYRPGVAMSLSERSSPMASRMGSQEDISRKGRFSFHRRTPSWSKVNSDRPGADMEPGNSPEAKKSPLRTHENPLKPLVTGVSPREGPVQGETKVILRGSNLGDCKASVLKVILAGVDCTSSVEYFSSCML